MSNPDTTDNTGKPGKTDDAPTDDALTKPETPVADDKDGAAEAFSEGEAAPEENDAKPEDVVAEVVKSKRAGSGGVAWLALFLALIGVAAIGYSLVADWRSERSAAASSEDLTTSLASLRNRVAAAENAAGSADQTIADLTTANTRLTSEIDRLQGQIDDRLDMLASLPPRMKNLENSMATLQGVSTGARDTWLLAEAEYYMQIANAQLQLAGNPELATLALGMADERIQQLANPALIDVRRALADELAALEVMDKPDIEGVTLTLASLSRVVSSLPLRRAAATGRDATSAGGEPASGLDRVWSSVTGAFSGLVRITPPEQAEMPLIAPEADYFLRANLALQLQAARLALVRGEQAAFDQSLDDASAWLHEYFDLQSAQVGSALQTINEIRAGLFTVDAPDISGSLALLRQYTTLAETAQ